MAELVLHQLSKTWSGRHQRVVAVDECDLAVGDGECVVVVGPSGCGKTTLLRLVAGLERPDRGTISIAGRDVTRLPPRDRDVAMVFQDFALYPHMRVRENLAFAMRLRNMRRSDIEQRIDAVAARLNITDLLDRKPGELSGGERQRAAVGRVLAREPACALYDEPLSNLDARLRVQMRSELKMVQSQFRTTTLYVTHDQEEAMCLGDRLVVMAEGRVQQVAQPLEIYRRPANRFVGGFVGPEPMNFIEGAIAASDDGLAFTDGGDIHVPLPPSAIGRSVAAGGRVVLGLRPEDLHVQPPSQCAFNIDVRVQMTEPIGGRVRLHGVTARGAGVTAVVVRKPDRAEMTLHFAAESIHLFESGPFGRRL